MGRFKNNLVFLSIFIISFLGYFQSKVIYELFNENYLPVFDGVMYEKTQILRYLSFKGNFSFIERINQVIYEFKGNPVSGGFNAILILFNPNFLINDYDLLLKSILALTLFFVSIKFFFNFKNHIYFVGICVLISQVPIFYHFRIGLSTYVPDLFSSLILASSYFFSLSYLKYNKIYFLSIALLLIILSVVSRFNFFVFSFLVYLPLFPSVFLQLKKLNVTNKKNLIHISIAFLSLLFLFFYVLYNFNDFLNYYTKPASYASVSFTSSLNSILIYFKEELGVVFALILIAILLIVNSIYNKNDFKTITYLNYYLTLPFLILFVFLAFILKATNQPHVFSILVVFLFPVSFIKIPFFLSIKVFVGSLFLITLTCSFYRYFQFYNTVSSSSSLKINSLGIAKKIDLFTNNQKEKSYFILYDTAQEIPLDVYFFKKNKIYTTNNLKFYFTDWDYYDIDKRLDLHKIATFYINQIIIQKPQIIVLNDYKLILGKDRRLAENLNKLLVQYVKNSTNYRKVGEQFVDKKKLVFYKLI
jgi:hypothetical protein